MTVLEFIEKYNRLSSTSAKNKMIESIMKRTYCPVLEKRVILQKMLEKSIATDSTNETIQYIDMFVFKLNYVMSIIILYTSLVIDTKIVAGEKIAKTEEIYDGLVESKIIKEIYEQIGEDELKELNNINEMLISNFDYMHCTGYAYLTKILNNATQLISTTIQPIIGYVDQLMGS